MAVYNQSKGITVMKTALQTIEPLVSLEQKAAAVILVRQLQDAFNAKDADAMGLTLSRNAVWTNGLGTRVVGRSKVVALARDMLTHFRDRFARYEIVHLSPIGHDAVLANVEQVPTDRTGRDIDGAHGAPLFVIARGDEGWRIVAGQNTIVAQLEEVA